MRKMRKMKIVKKKKITLEQKRICKENLKKMKIFLENH